MSVLRSVRLKKLSRTSGFRLALLFLSTFGAASLCLCLFLYLEVRQSTIDSLYRAVTREALRLNQLSDEGILERADLVQNFEQSGREITLFHADGTRIAGADLPFPSTPEWSKAYRTDANAQGNTPDLFCFAAPRSADNVLLVCRSSREIWVIQRVFRRVLLLGTAAIALIGAFAAVVLGSLSLRQIQSITTSVQLIMEGDFRGRLSTSDLSGDLAQLAETVNEMLSRLERLMLEVKNSSENIAHDLRTPLTRVLAKLERSIRSADSVDAMKDLTGEVVSEIKQIIYRFSALLRISELENRLRRSEFKRVDLMEILQDALDFYGPVAVEKSVSLMLYAPEARALVYGDRSLIFEAVSNLLDNALKHSPVGQRIDVTVGLSPIRLEIRDFGAGIRSSDVEKLKERYKKQSFEHQLPGFGIGLSIVDSIARLHNFAFDLEEGYPGCKARMTFGYGCFE